MDRSKKELYQIILDRYNKEVLRNSRTDYTIGKLFICIIMKACKSEKLISETEHKLIFRDFENNHPNENLHTEFTNYDGVIYLGGYCWWSLNMKVLDKGIEVRQRFLEKLIEIN